MQNNSGPAGATVWLVPNTLDLGADTDTPVDATVPAGTLQRAAALTHWVVEDAKTARAFLKRVGTVFPLALPLQAIDIKEMPRPPKDGRAAPDDAQWQALLAPVLAGADLGVLSEAGLPCVADPGARLVAAAQAAGLTVVPLAGATSLMLALAASGLQGQSFAFAGYLPTEPRERAARIRELETRSRLEGQTQITIETPYRNAALTAALLDTLQPDTRLGVACGLTLPGGWCRTRTVKQWRQAPPAFDDRRLPAVFLWLAA
jgi:16S rRNA (cytidine1402-2'-O)-methyltransferase